MSALLAILVPLALAPQEPAPHATPDQLREELDLIDAAVRAQWSCLDDKRERFGVDLDALLEEARAAVPQVRDRDDWQRVLRRLAAGLWDGHAHARVPDARWGPERRLPVEVADSAEGLVVVASDVEAVAVGDVLVAIDGVSVEERVAQLERLAIGSTPGMKRRVAVRDLHGLDADGATLTLVDGAGAERAVRVDAVALDAGPAPLRPPRDNWSLEWREDDVALLTITRFTVPRWSEWLAAPHEEREGFLVEAKARIEAVLDALREREARGLVIDLRGNGGGTDALGIHLAERLLEEPFRYFLLSARGDDGAWSPPGGLTYGDHDDPRWLGPVALLVDAGSFSTTDNFARCLDDLHPELTVVGRPSGGGTGAPRVFLTTPHTSATFGACTMRVQGPDGVLTEGVGTVPDVLVTWTRTDHLGGRDPDLAAALEALDR